MAEGAGVRVDERVIGFAVPDPEHRLAGVRLLHELDLPEIGEFRFDGGIWRLDLPAPPVRRMEYQLQLRHPDGGSETTTDPINPHSTPGAFGAKSVLELPGYTAPAWLGTAKPWPDRRALSFDTAAGPVEIDLRSPAEPTGRILVAHDGPEYDALSGLGEFAAAVVGAGRVPPFHLALAAPGARNDRYSADPGYTEALGSQVLPGLRREVASETPVVLMGASLGALSALVLQRRYPDLVGGLFLQSGSFFTPTLDACEAQFPHFAQITTAVERIHRNRPLGVPVPAVLTCGSAEENIRNNRLMATTLREQGYRASLREVPDAHNYVAWRDAFDPHLVELLNGVWADA